MCDLETYTYNVFVRIIEKRLSEKHPLLFNFFYIIVNIYTVIVEITKRSTAKKYDI